MRRLAVAGTAAAVAAGLAAGLTLTLGSSSPSRKWVLRDLGTLPGLTECGVVAMNEQGQIVGWCYTPPAYGRQHGFIWQAGRFTDLGQGFLPKAINNRGEVVGQGPRYAFLWHGRKLTTLATPVGARSAATAISEGGEIAGTVYVAKHPRGVVWRHGKTISLGRIWQPTAINARGEVVGIGPGAFIWRSGKAIDLGPFSLSSESIAVNDRGQVVWSGEEGAYLWRRGKRTSLGARLFALAIDERGRVLLEFDRGANSGDAFLWERGNATLLPHFGQHNATWAVAMNEHGQVIGRSLWSIGWPLPFVWQVGQKMVALPTLDVGGGPPFTYAVAINDHDQIAGDGYVLVHGHTQQHVVLWTRR